MKKNRAVSLIALVLNMAIVGLAVYAGIKIFANGLGLENFKLFTISATAFLALASLCMIPCMLASLIKGEYKVPLFFKGFKLMGVVAVLTTLTLNVISTIKPEFVFDFGVGDWFDFNLFYVMAIRLCLPVLAFLSFAFFEGGKKSNYGLAAISILPVVAYVGTYVVLAIAGNVWTDFYQMHQFGPEVLGSASDLWYLAAIFVVLIALIFGTIVWAINRAISLNKPVAEKPAPVEQPAPAPVEEKPVEKKADWAREEEPAEKPAEQPAPAPVVNVVVNNNAPVEKPAEEKPVETPAPVEQPAPAPAPVVVPAPVEEKPAEEVAAAEEKPAEKKPAAKKPAAKKPVATKPAPYSSKVYHVSKQQNTGKWQIKVAGAERALKLFDTQKDAIDYVKELVKTKGGSYRVHSVAGKMRKA